MLKCGSHLGTVRMWMQRKFNNGDRVIWGSNDQLSNSGITVVMMEELAQDIKRALLEEYKIKDHDHKYKYMVCARDHGPAFKGVDTREEMWSALFKPKGRVSIYKLENSRLRKTLFCGTVEEARKWVLEIKEGLEISEELE